MNSRDITKIYYTINQDQEETKSILDLDYSKIIIPFSKIYKSNKPKDIYSGNEKIPFKERDSDYKTIFRQEFANILKDEFKSYSPVVSFPFF